MNPMVHEESAEISQLSWVNVKPFISFRVEPKLKNKFNTFTFLINLSISFTIFLNTFLLLDSYFFILFFLPKSFSVKVFLLLLSRFF